ncbi:MAG: type II toxin-antitoxin system HicB family antitoxin [Coriobacteriia bacterium]|nr:type II toxin-antitoxin system HicB family antitoxin [Coriobacteriia bacterium]
MYIYQAIITKEEDGFFAVFENFEEVFAEGNTLDEVVLAAAETLQLTLAEYIDTGLGLPEAVFNPARGDEERMAIAVDVTEGFIERTKCLTVSEAAQRLGVSKGRVSQMLTSGALQAVPFGNERLVTIASVNNRKTNPGQPGRPRKEIRELVAV